MRDPKRLFARYGRQLLVQGAEFTGQERLHAWTAAIAAEAATFGQAAAEACARYLVGAGVGRVIAPSAWRGSLVGLDPLLELADAPRDAGPVAHFWFRQTSDGASVAIRTDEARCARACAVTWLAPPSASDALAIAVGAHAAGLLLEDVLGLRPLPSHELRQLPGAAIVGQDEPAAAPPSLLSEWQSTPAVWSVLMRAATAAYPSEACGLILRAADGGLYGLACENLQNRYHALDPRAFPRTSATAYLLDPRRIAEEEAAGAALLAIWHSHCDASAAFSAEDARAAVLDGEPLFPGVVHCILSVQAGVVAHCAVHAWDGARGSFQEIARG